MPTEVLENQAPVKKLMTLFPNFQGVRRFTTKGYSPTKKGYKCYHPPTKKHYLIMDPLKLWIKLMGIEWLFIQVKEKILETLPTINQIVFRQQYLMQWLKPWIKLMGIEWLFIQSLRENPIHPSYNQSESVSPTILGENPVETSPNPLTNNETMAERPKTPILNVYSKKKRSIITSPAPIVNLETETHLHTKPSSRKFCLKKYQPLFKKP
ncbi:hypothetical protein AAG906_016018 [Vitis piasezkii]